MSRHHDDGYRGFARHYDLHGWDWFALSHGRLLVELLERRDVAGGRVLDAGCGSGTLALALAERGFRVTGIDLSERLLETARLKDTGGTVTWLQGDITDFEIPGQTFDAITCVADTLNHLERLDAWEAAFRRFAAHLRPGGLLFIDVATSQGLRRMDKQSVGEHRGRTLILACIYEPASRRSTLKVTSFVPSEREPGLYERASGTITEWGQPVSGVLERLHRAGFEDPERPWATSEDAEGDDRLQLIASRAR